MKNKFIALAAAGAFGLSLAACTDGEVEQSEASQHAASAVEEAKTAVALSWGQFADYSVEKKEQAVDLLREQGSSLDKQIATLRQKAGEASGEAKEQYNEAVAELSDERSELSEQIDELQAATAENWDEVKSETREKWDDFVAFLDRKTDQLD